MNYRDKLDIIADILTVASKNAKRTQIMYQANLSYKVMRRYLEEVMAASMVSFNENARAYEVTEKGKKFLSYYRDYFKSSKLLEKRLGDMRDKRKILEDLCRSCAESNALAAVGAV